MRNLLHLLLRIGRTEAERDALRGDLEEAYRTQVRPSRSWLGAQVWYAREVLAAFACAVSDNAGVRACAPGSSATLAMRSAAGGGVLASRSPPR